MTKPTRQELNQALAKVLAYAEVGKFEQAQEWGEILIRKLELAAVFKAGSVNVANSRTLWLPVGRT